MPSIKPAAIDLSTDQAIKASMREIAQLFRKFNTPIASAKAAGEGQAVDPIEVKKVRRVNGISYREVLIIMADGQTVTLRVKTTGDVFQVAIGSRVVPIHRQDDLSSAVREIVDLLNAGRARFVKAQSVKRTPMPSGVRASRKVVVSALKSRLAKWQTVLAEAKDELAELLERQAQTVA